MNNRLKHRSSDLVQIPIQRVVDICNIWTKNTGSSELRARCPFCGGQRNKPTASVNVNHNLFYCHRCGEGYNAVSLFAKLVGTNNRQAYRELLDAA